MTRAAKSWFYDCKLMNTETGHVLEKKVYREAELGLLGDRESSRFWNRTGRWGGEGLSEERNEEWDDAKMLVGRDDEVRDDETLCGD